MQTAYFFRCGFLCATVSNHLKFTFNIFRILKGTQHIFWKYSNVCQLSAGTKVIACEWFLKGNTRFTMDQCHNSPFNVPSLATHYV